MLWTDQLRDRNRRIEPSLLLICLAVLALLTGRLADCAEPLPGEEGAEFKVDHAGSEFFEKNVRPILAARCHGCHGPAKQKGGLRLDACARP